MEKNVNLMGDFFDSHCTLHTTARVRLVAVPWNMITVLQNLPPTVGWI